MSSKLMGAAFYVPLPTSERLLLLALCDHANDEGEHVFPGQRRLAVKVGVRDRRLRQMLVRLQAAGLLEHVREPAPGRGAEYRVRARVIYARAAEVEAQLLRDEHRHSTAGVVADAGNPESLNAGNPESGAVPYLVSKKQPLPETTRSILSGKPDVGSLKVQAREILAYLNKRSGRNFRETDTNVGVIVARLKEGATLDQCRAVIGLRAAKWKGDPKMEEYLRPLTIFRRSNFDQYMGDLPMPEPEPDLVTEATHAS